MPWSIQRDSRCPSSKPYAVIKRDGGKLVGCHVSRRKARAQITVMGMHEAGKERQMPYPNEHAARIHDPKGYVRIRRQNNKFGSGIHAIFGVRDDGKTELQAIRFDRKKFTVAQARKWLKDHDYSTGGFEAATGKTKEMEPEIYEKATEPEAAEVQGDDLLKMMGDYVARYVPWSVTTFAELKAARQADEAAVEVSNVAADLQGLLSNRVQMIMADETIEDKAAAIVDGLQELADELAEVVTEEVQEEELEKEAVNVEEVDERSGDIDETGSPAKKEGWFDDLVSRVKEALGLSKPTASEPSLMLWKDADTGQYRWIARYSNNFRDDDNPPEIISAQSHQRFDQMVNKGEAPMPELWLWHRPEWKWGVATWHAYDDTGFPMAAGVVDRGKEALAEHLMALDPSLVRVSHGMPKDSIVRDPDDESVIVEHVTREISPLPAGAAANHLTGFILFKEATMTIPTDKKDGLVEQWKLSPELLDQIEAANASDAKQEAEAGTERKEKDAAAEAAPESVAEVEETPTEPAITREEMRAALEAVGQAIAALTEQVKELQGQVTEVKEIKTVEQAKSLSEVFLSAIGHPDARVDGRTAEAKDRPRQNLEKPQLVNTGNPLADSVIGGILDGSWAEELKH